MCLCARACSYVCYVLCRAHTRYFPFEREQPDRQFPVSMVMTLMAKFQSHGSGGGRERQEEEDKMRLEGEWGGRVVDKEMVEE